MSLRRLLPGFSAAALVLNLGVRLALADGGAPPEPVPSGSARRATASAPHFDDEALRKAFRHNGIPEEQIGPMIRSVKRRPGECPPDAASCLAWLTPGENPRGGFGMTVDSGSTTPPKKRLPGWGPAPLFQHEPLAEDASFPSRDAGLPRDARDES